MNEVVKPERRVPSAIGKQFEKTLLELDEKRDWNLSQVWKECVKLHDDNAVLRLNLDQLQVMWQEKASDLMRVKDRIAEHMDTVSTGDEDFLGKMKTSQAVVDNSLRAIGSITTTIVNVNKEIRASEFQSKFYFHVNLVQQFMAGMTGILFKHLQSTDKLDAILADMKQLSKVFAYANPNQKNEDGE